MYKFRGVAARISILVTAVVVSGLLLVWHAGLLTANNTERVNYPHLAARVQRALFWFHEVGSVPVRDASHFSTENVTYRRQLLHQQKIRAHRYWSRHFSLDAGPFVPDAYTECCIHVSKRDITSVQQRADGQIVVTATDTITMGFPTPRLEGSRTATGWTMQHFADTNQVTFSVRHGRWIAVNYDDLTKPVFQG